MKPHALQVKKTLVTAALIAAAALGNTQIRADVLAEWKFGTLPEGAVREVPSSVPGGIPLTQDVPDSEPVAVRIERNGADLMAVEFYSARRQFLRAPAEGPYDFQEHTGFTIEVGVQVYSYPEQDGTARQIVMKRSREGTYAGWSLAVTPEGFAVFAIAGEAEPAKVIRSGEPLPLSEWVSLAATRSDDGRMELFVDGVSVARGAGTSASLANESEMFVGKHSGAENRNFYFDGAISGIRISSGASEIDPETVFTK
jgi:hypothetical protein